MVDAHSFALFVGAALVLLLTPGPAVMFVVTRSVQDGRAAGLASTVGLGCGALIHVGAAVVGLSAVLASSALAFHLVKLVGAGYLFYLGFRALRDRWNEPWTETDRPIPASPRRHFVDGFVVNLFNPKPAIFFLAFLPQFVDPAHGAVRPQLALLGLTFVSLALLTDGSYALAAAWSRSWLLRKRSALRFQPYLSAAIYFGLGASAALAGRRVD